MQVEARLRQLEGKTDEAAVPRGLANPTKYNPSEQNGILAAAPVAYNADADIALGDKKKEKKDKKEKKEKNEKKRKAEDVEAVADEGEKKKKKKEKKEKKEKKKKSKE